MATPFGTLLERPWQVLDALVDGPLHPGGHAATGELLDRAGVDEGTRLLDLGCGAGGALSRARSRGAAAVGLDHAPGASPAVRGDLSAIPFAAGTFDVALGECVLCLADDFDRTVADVGRILEPGGRLAISDVTVDGPPPEVAPPFDRLLCLDGPRDVADLRDRIERAGFSILDVRTHREDLLEMRDRIRDAVDYERLVGTGGQSGVAGIDALDRAVETGRVGYVSIVARRRGETEGEREPGSPSAR